MKISEILKISTMHKSMNNNEYVNKIILKKEVEKHKMKYILQDIDFLKEMITKSINNTALRIGENIVVSQKTYF